MKIFPDNKPVSVSYVPYMNYLFGLFYTSAKLFQLILSSFGKTLLFARAWRSWRHKEEDSKVWFNDPLSKVSPDLISEMITFGYWSFMLRVATFP